LTDIDLIDFGKISRRDRELQRWQSVGFLHPFFEPGNALVGGLFPESDVVLFCEMQSFGEVERLCVQL